MKYLIAAVLAAGLSEAWASSIQAEPTPSVENAVETDGERASAWRQRTAARVLEQDGFVMMTEAEAAEIAAQSDHPLGSAWNPVRASMPTGQRAYLDRLRCEDGAPPTYERRGQAPVAAFHTIVDIYDVDCGTSAPGAAEIHIDMYHNHVETAPVPGFSIIEPLPRLQDAFAAAQTSLAETFERDGDAMNWQVECEAGDLMACSDRLGVAEVSTTDLDQIASLLEARCEAGSGFACGELGLMHLQARGSFVEDAQRAFEYWQVGCLSYQDDLSCAMLGIAYYDGDLVEMDRARAIEFYRLSCDLENWIGCRNLGLLYYNGEPNLIAQDFTEAFRLLTQSCAAGSYESCVDAGFQLMRAEGVQQDVQTALSVFDTYCDLDDAYSCHLGAEALLNHTFPPNPERARVMMQRACDLTEDKEVCARIVEIDRFIAAQENGD